MGERVIYSTLCTLDGARPDDLRPLVEMANLWAAHLRGPARFDGRVILLTNVASLRVDGAESIDVPFAATDRRTLFVERVRHYKRVPVARGGLVAQLDLDALTVTPLDPLFDAVRPGALSAATSGLSPLAHEHCGGLMTRRERWRYRVFGWDRRPGVSACVTACRGEDFAPLMRRWTAAIRTRGRGRPMPELGDQAFLNWLFLTRAADVRRLPRGLVHHVRQAGEPLDDPAASRAAVLHFPIPHKLGEMRRRSRVAGAR